MPTKIALAGNPNCGKTTLFNDLTGSSQYVGNWPGVTVEKKEGRLKGHKDVIITDLPGVYSLSPYTLEEVVSRNYLINEHPDAIINLVDGTNLERNLYLTTQILELGIPVVISLNMMDIVKKSGDRIDSLKLGASLGCEVVETAAIKGEGSLEAAEKAIALAKGKQTPAPQGKFSKQVEETLSGIAKAFKDILEPQRARWYAVKLFERDEKVLGPLQFSSEQKNKLESLILPIEEEYGDDSETIITNERYEYIAQLVNKCLRKNSKGMSVSDKIDRIATNRFLALPIFAAIMFLMYYTSVTTLGRIATDWVNDTLFGTWITNGATAALSTVGAADWLNGLIVNGIIGGVGTVLGFVPQMLILFFFLSLLEDSGYMARVAFIMDRIFRKFGLSGKSFIPILIGTGCGVPAIMAARTIENEKDRRMTIMLSTFMPCTAKTVIIAMIASTFFPKSFWIAPAMYFLGIAIIILSGIGLKKTAYFGGEPAPFVMELPPYHIPALKGVLIHMWERSRAFVIKAGTIIFTACVLIWFLSSFGWTLKMVDIESSMLAGIGHAIAWLFAPLGFGNWKGAVATISALMAKESAIGTLAVLNGVADPNNTQFVMTGIASMFTALGAFSFMLLNLFDPPCIVAMATTSREMGNSKWTAIAIGYQVVLGYSIAFIVNQLGSVLFYGASFGIGQSIALLLLALAVFLLIRPSSHRGTMFGRAGKAI
ncbi:Ferrous iron transport protein B, N-terminal [Acididesulfobacillus acetoxydans]|uniref:Ferrous iron transport protein B n=1 Tax=Acididesulfobacillus acetoxydans TaxID=1561005 RepID=A0A8S0X5V4_9FIRM|nr:ferrous iron transport protein B [Acididesulfobacillus acetoxydans]CAA7601960.1 Ferrous iron transport protein B, N-terminal [Acididesulfobacillus acetoxydans]CEJ08196.1 Ferrous iron transport protein B [Acididesulfobacillus acetoxydans]